MNSSVYPLLPSAIHLYWEGNLGSLDFVELGGYLTLKTCIPCHLRGNPYQGLFHEKKEEIAKEFAQARVRDPAKRLEVREPLQGEWEYERRRIQEHRWKIFGILYDGVLYQRIVSEVMPSEELIFNICNILFTNQLFGTWDWNDRRYHARVSLYGFPNLISISGMVEAPAKPKEFYLKKQMGFPIEILKKEYEGRFVDHDDPRMTDLLKGFALQALFFHIFGEPFCKEPDCRFFNAHWQEELFRAQLGGVEFCQTHETLLKRMRLTKCEKDESIWGE